MAPIKGAFIGQGSLQIVYATWLPDLSPRGLVVLVHGYGEHMGRYRHVAEALVEHGYAVYTIDHRGHGESEGMRASVERFEYFVADLRLLVERVTMDHPMLPVFMIGHSMGGLIATHYALQYPDDLAGLVLSGAALHVGDGVSPVLKRLSRIVARVAPSLPVTAATAATESVLSRDPLVQEAFDADPLTYKGKVRARMGYEMLRAGQIAQQRSAELTLPLLVMYGTDDKLVNPIGSDTLFARAASRDKTLKTWQGYRHEIFNELEKDEVIGFVMEWLNQRTTAQCRRQPLTALA